MGIGWADHKVKNWLYHQTERSLVRSLTDAQLGVEFLRYQYWSKLFDIFINDLEDETDGASLPMTPDWGDQLTYWRAQLSLRAALTSWRNQPARASWWSTKTRAKSCTWDRLSTCNTTAWSNTAEKDLAILVDKRSLEHMTYKEKLREVGLATAGCNYCVQFPGVG